MDAFRTAPGDHAKERSSRHPLNPRPRNTIDTYVSSTSGHQTSDIKPGPSYTSSRSSKLKEQLKSAAPESSIFANCTIYLNGSFSPTIGDLELKRLLVSHGANVVYALGRKSCTHVILGRGLAGGKIQKETTVKNNRVQYVNVHWVLESIQAGKRLSEARFSVIKHSKQTSVHELFATTKNTRTGNLHGKKE